MIIGNGAQLKKVMQETAKYKELKDGLWSVREEPWSMVAINVYDEHYLRGVLAASASKQAPIIAEVSASSAAALGDGSIVRGLNQLGRTLENIADNPDHLVFKGLDGKNYELLLDDAMIFLYLDHFVVGDYLKKNDGNFDKTLLQVEKLFQEIAKIPLLAGGMIDAGAVDLEQNIKVSKMVVDILRAQGKFSEAEYSATGGLGEEASGHEEHKMTTDKTRPTVVRAIRDYGKEVNPNALAYAAGATHIAISGKKSEFDWLLLEAVQKEDVREGTIMLFPIHGGSSIADEELEANRGLYWKVNKATEPKRYAMEAIAKHLFVNREAVMADLSGDIEGVFGNKKLMDDVHHPKNISFPPRETTMLFATKYLDVVGSTGKTPYLKEKVLQEGK